MRQTVTECATSTHKGHMQLYLALPCPLTKAEWVLANTLWQQKPWRYIHWVEGAWYLRKIRTYSKNTKTCKNNIDKHKENKGFPLKSTLETSNDLKQKNILWVNVCMFIIFVEGKYTIEKRQKDKRNWSTE